MKIVLTLMAATAVMVAPGLAQEVREKAAPEAPRPLDEALIGQSKAAPAPQAHRGRDWDDDDWSDDDWDDDRRDRDRDWQRGDRDDRYGDRRRERSVRLTCGSEDYRYRFCDVPGGAQDVVLVRQRSWAPCREGQDWGRRRGGIWVDHGCEAEFRVSLRGRGHAGGYGYGYGYEDRQDPPRGLVRSCVREARYEYGEGYRLDRVLRAAQGRRGWRVELRLERERDRRDRRYDRRGRRLDVTCRTGRRGIQVAAR